MHAYEHLNKQQNATKDGFTLEHLDDIHYYYDYKQKPYRVNVKVITTYSIGVPLLNT